MAEVKKLEACRQGGSMRNINPGSVLTINRRVTGPGPVKKPGVAAYCRVSTLLHSQEPSIEAQRAHYEQKIRSRSDWKYAGIYIESGFSGTKAENRPALQSMLKACREGKIDLILTKSISRFARNTMECLEMVRKLTSVDVSIYFEKENIHTGTMESELMLSLLACFAESESRSISGNMKWGIRKRFANGTYRQTVPPYGYVWKEGRLAVETGQADIIREIFAMVLAGSSVGSISRELNERGIPSPHGRCWSPAGIRYILANPVYMGDMLYQKTYMDREYRQRINRGELDCYYRIAKERYP